MSTTFDVYCAALRPAGIANHEWRRASRDHGHRQLQRTERETLTLSEGYLCSGG